MLLIPCLSRKTRLVLDYFKYVSPRVSEVVARASIINLSSYISRSGVGRASIYWHITTKYTSCISYILTPHFHRNLNILSIIVIKSFSNIKNTVSKSICLIREDMTIDQVLKGQLETFRQMYTLASKRGAPWSAGPPARARCAHRLIRL